MRTVRTLFYLVFVSLSVSFAALPLANNLNLDGAPLQAIADNNIVYVSAKVTNASAAIQSAIDEVSGGGGGTVVLTDGTYLLTKTLTITSDKITIRGQGRSTVLTIEDEVKSLITNAGTSGAAGQRTIQVTDVRGFRVGMDCIVRETSISDGTDWESCKIESISG